MRKKLIKSLLALIVIFSVCLPQLPQATAAATVIEEMPLTMAKTAEGSFDGDEEVQWYKITPGKDTIKQFTHLRIKLQSQSEVNMSVYSSLENATNDNTFEQYRGYSYDQETASIDFPISWVGPYYIKLESYVEEDEEGNLLSNAYKISYDGVSLPPSNGAAGEECPAELSVEKKKNGKVILSDLRSIRENLLSKTDNGKELTAVYYKSAPFITSKMLFDKNLREDVYANLSTLKNLLSDTAKNGGSSTYAISAKEQEAISNLYTIAHDAVPGPLKTQLEKSVKNVDLSKLSGTSVSQVVSKAGLSTSSSAADPSRLIVKVKDGQPTNRVKSKVQSYGIKSVDDLAKKELKSDRFLVVEVKNNGKGFSASSKTTANQIAKLPEVEFVEPVQTYTALSADSQYDYQWSLKNNDKKGGDIGYEALSKLLKGKKLPDTIIAVADTGVDHTLADLSGNVLVDKGYNFVDSTNDAMDDNGHGTHVSSIIAAKQDNDYSMAGINPYAKILPIKVLDSSGGGDTEQIAAGIMYAADKGAKVLNLSLGGGYSRTIEYAMQYASKKGVTIVAASGNDGMEELNYPGSSKYAIAVGSTSKLDIVSDFSNYGKGLDLVAPGSAIPALLPDGNVTYMSGTSMSTPHVAAVAGLLLSQKPNLKAAEVQSLLNKTAVDVAFDEQDNPYTGEEEYWDEEEYGPYPVEEALPPGYDYVSGWGRLDAYSVVSTLDLGATINPILNNSTKVTGKAKNGSSVKVFNGKKELGKGSVKSGSYSITIPVQKTDQILTVVITNGNAKTSVNQTVEKAPAKPKVKKVTNKDTAVSGTAQANLKVNIKNSSRKVIATGKVDQAGSYKVKIPKQKENAVLYVTVQDGYKESSETKVTVIDVIPPAAPKAKAISDRSTSITGTTEAKAQVVAKVKGKQIAKAKADAKGKFTLKIKKQKAGTTVVVTATDAAGNTSKGTNLKVADKTPPAAPKVNSVNDKSTSVKGKTEAGATVTVKVKNKKLGEAKANKKGEFTVKIKKQKAKTVLSVTAKDKAGNVSKAKNVTVKKK
ncbi:S8 family serine peptidase [Rossellomorea marisflavi]|uniref:S8 family peptidase n=1 Tax=Rossellomorea marisflavi TaxID=189381 RepID=UPI0028530AE9|nr:Ig-like domain-containing protein [Rossellomorea marisflavi]MDR4935252.1 S8 family serine peptidase [Rossellomorea marisflavi]